MSKKAPAEAGELGEFEGSPVVAALAVVRNAGDGLSEAMRFAPFKVHQGERRYLVLDVTCTDVQFPQVPREKGDEDDELQVARKHIFRASTGLFLDDQVVAEAVQRQAERMETFREAERRRKEEAKGIFRLPEMEDDELPF